MLKYVKICINMYKYVEICRNGRRSRLVFTYLIVQRELVCEVNIKYTGWANQHRGQSRF